MSLTMSSEDTPIDVSSSTELRIERVDDHPIVSNITVNAWKGGQKVGAVTICSSEDDHSHDTYSIEWVEVNEGYRQQGIATRMLEAVKDWLGDTCIEVLVVNQYLLSVFLELGFIIRRPEFLANDLTMIYYPPVRIERIDNHPTVDEITINAWKGDQKVGTVRIINEFATNHTIECVEVPLEHRRQGVATQMLRAIKGWFADHYIGVTVINPYLVPVLVKLGFTTRVMCYFPPKTTSAPSDHTT